MINKLIKELEETWSLTTEELNDIRDKMEEVASSYYWLGFNENIPETSVQYGKTEDQE